MIRIFYMQEGVETNLNLRKELFPSGESKFTLEGFNDLEESSKDKEVVTINWKFEDEGKDFLDLMVLLHSKQIQSFKKKILYIPYLPFMRMDRNNGNKELIVSANAMLDILKGAPVDDILVGTLHSQLNERDYIKEIALENILYEEIAEDLESKGFTVIPVFPDKGAQERQAKLSAKGEATPWLNTMHITADKIRNFETGKIEKITANVPNHTKKLLESNEKTALVIIDDICSYGGTFIGVKEAIQAEVEHYSLHVLCVAHLEEVAFKGKVTDEFDIVLATDSLLQQEIPKTNAKILIAKSI